MTQVSVLTLWPGEPPGSNVRDGFLPWLEAYPVETTAPRGAVLICPGGGYGGRAPHEAAPVAHRFNQAGMHAFVVHYRVAPHRHPAPLLDVARAMRLIRHHAETWHVDPAHVAVCGFSAGGHLAASLSVHFDDPDARTGDAFDAIPARPDASILCYPVISSGPFAHRGSFENLLGPEIWDGAGAHAAPLFKMSLERQVSERTPPAFLWHTADDQSVPVENSLLYAQALRAHGVPFELHVYPRGVHGLGLAEGDPHIATWTALCGEWLAGMGWLGKPED